MTFRRSTFIAVILWTATSPSLAVEQAPQAKIAPAAAPVTPLAARPLARFSVTRDRPLFSPTRRPPAAPAVVAPPPPPPPPPPNVMLLGVVMDGDDAHALVRTGPAAKVLRLRIGDKIGGWEVGQIESRKLVLLLNGRTATFTMFSAKDLKRWPKTAAEATPPNAQPTAPNESGPIMPSSRRGTPHRQLRHN